MDLAGDVDFQGCEDVAGRLGDAGALAGGAGGPGEGADGDALQVASYRGPGLAGLVLRDADQEQGEPAEDDVGADALFEPVVDGPQVKDWLYALVPIALTHEVDRTLPIAQVDAHRI